jgi:hypothetical protein
MSFCGEARRARDSFREVFASILYLVSFHAIKSFQPVERARNSCRRNGRSSTARLELEDLWRLADAGPKPARVMSFEEMNAAKARGAARSC